MEISSQLTPGNMPHVKQSMRDLPQLILSDGTVEALEGTKYPYLMTYQFHPEMMSINNADAKLIFKNFVETAVKMKGAK